MSFWQFVHHTQLAIARRPLAVRLAARVQNQCRRIVGLHLQDGIDLETNGEGLLADRVAPHCRTFVDVGANVGAWAARVLERAPREARGVLLEPSSSAGEALRRRFAGERRVELVQAAAGAEAGRAVFHQEPDAGETSSLVGAFSNRNAIATEVEVTTVDREVERRGWDGVDLLKVDTEGFDLHVLRGARGLLERRAVGVLQFEYNEPWALAGATLAGAFGELEPRGYAVFLLRRTGLHPFRWRRYGEYFSYSNFVAVAPDRMELVRALIRAEA